MNTIKVDVMKNTKHTQKKPKLRKRTDRAWFSRLYDIRPGNG